MPILLGCVGPTAATGHQLRATGYRLLLYFFFIRAGFGGKVDSRMINSGTIGTASG